MAAARRVAGAIGTADGARARGRRTRSPRPRPTAPRDSDGAGRRRRRRRGRDGWGRRWVAGVAVSSAAVPGQQPEAEDRRRRPRPSRSRRSATRLSVTRTASSDCVGARWTRRRRRARGGAGGGCRRRAAAPARGLVGRAARPLVLELLVDSRRRPPRPRARPRSRRPRPRRVSSSNASGLGVELLVGRGVGLRRAGLGLGFGGASGSSGVLRRTLGSFGHSVVSLLAGAPLIGRDAGASVPKRAAAAVRQASRIAGTNRPARPGDHRHEPEEGR